MDNETTERVAHYDEIDLREFFSVLWEGKRTIALITALSTFISVSIALYLPNKYTSEALLAPRVDGGAGGALGQLASQYGDLAGLAGVTLGGLNDGSKATIAKELISSREFFGEYLYEEVLIDLMAAEGWDRASNSSILDPAIYDEARGIWVRDVGPERKTKPSIQEAHTDFVKDFLDVSEDNRTGFVSVSVTHFSPFVSQQWVTMVVNGVNDAVRARDVKEAENSIAFLNQQREKTELVSLNEIFSELIEEQTKIVMLANASEEYVFQVIDPPIAPELRSEPGRVLISVLGALFGGLIPTIFLLTRYFVSRGRGTSIAHGSSDIN